MPLKEFSAVWQVAADVLTDGLLVGWLTVGRRVDRGSPYGTGQHQVG